MSSEWRGRYINFANVIGMISGQNQATSFRGTNIREINRKKLFIREEGTETIEQKRENEDEHKREKERIGGANRIKNSQRKM